MRKHCGNCANYKKEINQFSDECGKCVTERLKNGETTNPSHWREKPQTNADRIRSMSDEELAEFIVNIKARAAFCKAAGNNEAFEKLCSGEWLQQPAKEADNGNRV